MKPAEYDAAALDRLAFLLALRRQQRETWRQAGGLQLRPLTTDTRERPASQAGRNDPKGHAK